ncbi:nucleotidyltransferase family protein [Pendulispora rubella]|uniref:Nucleotidyltransferase family protein n=1 Tax=Pendulispora rubella TaxID=2741070 RepID=A0ABZ2LC96_9BACT
MDLDGCLMNEGQKLRDALVCLNRSSAQIAFVTDASLRVIGLLTDGDVRRALLDGASLESPVRPYINRNFVSVDANASRVQVLELMEARRIHGVPILDDKQRLVGLHRLQDIVRHERRPNWAVVMAGGRGTRLAPLTHSVPKPMIRVAGRPILERIVLHLVGVGIERIFLAINYLGEQVERHFGDGRALGCRIEYLKEDQPLGTGGALALLPEVPKHPVLVMNGDLITEADLGGIIDFHEQHASDGTRATIGVRQYYHRVPFGCIEVDGDRVVALEEKPTLSRVVNAGIYVFSPELIARIPKEYYPLTQAIEQVITQGETVRAYEVKEDWIDVGQRDQLRQALGDVPHE